MKLEFPLEFKLPTGTAVVVNKTGPITYEFNLKPEDGPASSFTFVEDDSFTKEVEDAMPFEHLDAIRTFWLKQETSDE